jgi:hypothetical protein
MRVKSVVRQAPSRKAREGAHPQLFRPMSKTNLGYSSPLKRPTRPHGSIHAPALELAFAIGSFSHDPGSGLAGILRLALVRVELLLNGRFGVPGVRLA